MAIDRNEFTMFEDLKIRIGKCGYDENGVFHVELMPIVPEIEILGKLRDMLERNEKHIQINTSNYIEGYCKGLRHAIELLEKGEIS